MTRKKSISFEASAFLQRLIGRELVPNDEMAIVELIKNAYDSGATRVNVYLQSETPKEPGFIRLSDDGSGMSEADVVATFMFAGHSDRANQLRRKRIPTGEKGIGRFAADKLGETLDVYTKTRDSADGIHLTIDWRDFDDRAKRFNQVQATYTVGPTPAVPYQHGTTLEIGKLRAKWSAEKVDSLRTWLGDLFDPFSRPDDFTLTLEVARSRAGLEEIEPVLPDADLLMDVAVKSSERVRRVIKTLPDQAIRSEESVTTAANLESLQELHARFLYFLKRPNKRSSRGLEPGVRMYRDGFRIEPFGARSADWLHIAEKRAKRAGHAHVVPSRLFGFVEISRKSNPDLADTTSRQALRSTDGASNLVTVLREQLDAFENHLRIQAEPRWKENRRAKAVAFEQARLHTLGVISYGLAHELRQPLQSIRGEAGNIRTRLAKLGIDDPMIASSQASIDRGVERIDENIGVVSEISKGSVEAVALVDLVDLVRRVLALLKHRCDALGIQVRLEASDKQEATLNEVIIQSVLVNYIQNAVDSISTSGNESGEIRVLVTKRRRDNYVEVTDTGPGVSAEVAPSIFKKFATKKTAGMGVGLFYCKTIIESHGGTVGFTTSPKGAKFWFSLPEGQ